MEKAYSLDLREKIISFVRQGHSKREASKVFNIGEDTIYRWLRRFNAGEPLLAKKRTHFVTKVPIEVLKSYVEEQPDRTLKEIGAAIGLSDSKVWKHLNKMNMTQKKDCSLCGTLPRRARGLQAKNTLFRSFNYRLHRRSRSG